MKVFYISLAVSVVLIVVGFFAPPIGVIDNSVLRAVGFLLLFATVSKIPEVVKNMKNVKLQKGDTSVVISKD